MGAAGFAPRRRRQLTYFKLAAPPFLQLMALSAFICVHLRSSAAHIVLIFPAGQAEGRHRPRMKRFVG
jgi:hypothetical protein